MHFLILFTLINALLTGLATANFHLYRVRQRFRDGNGYAYRDLYHLWPWDQSPSCDQVLGRNGQPANKNYIKTNDVSGDRIGVVCEGGCIIDSDADNFDRVEMHFSNNPLYAWTIYKNRYNEPNGRREYRMYGRNGQTYGVCYPYSGHTYDCTEGTITYAGSRKLRCIITYSANTIKAAN